MKNIEIEKIIKRNLKTFIDSYNFDFHRNILYKLSQNNMLLGFCFEKSGFDKNGVYIWVFVQPLYLKSDSIILNFGKRLKGKKGEFWQLKNNPNLEEIISDLVPILVHENNEFLKKLDNSLKFYNFYQDKLVNIRTVEAITYSAIYSNIENSQLILENYVSTLKRENLSIDWIKDLLIEAENLNLVISDCKKLQQLFQNNIHYTKKAIGISS